MAEKTRARRRRVCIICNAEVATAAKCWPVAATVENSILMAVTLKW